MSRRGAVLEGYKVPDLTNPINPIDAHRMVSQERMHGQELEQQKEQQKAKAQQQRDKDLGDLKVEPGNSGTIYDATGLMETQELNKDMMNYAKENPNVPIHEIKMKFADRANRIARFYQKAKTIRLGNEAAIPELNRLGGYNLAEVNDKGIRLALIDPQTGKIRTDINTIDETLPWWSKAIEAYPMETTTGEALHNYVNDPKSIGKYSDEDKFIDKNKGFVHKKFDLNIPGYFQTEKDAKGKMVRDENGKISLEPKYELLPKSEIFPDGVKVLSADVFKDIKKTAPAAYQRVMGEVAHYIKTNNNEKDDNVAPNSVEAENIARMLLYKDIKSIWGNRGVTEKDIVAQPPVTNITNNINTGADGKNPYNDTWGRIAEHYKQSKENYLSREDIGDDVKDKVKRDEFLIAMNGLDTDAINLISNQVNASRGETSKIEPDDMYVSMTDGKIEVYLASKDKDGKKVGYKDKDNLRGVLPPSANLKTPQAGTKEKRAAQAEAKQREGGKGDGKIKTISDYPSDIQTGIKAFMKANRLSEAEAIKTLKAAGKI